jgi:predicted SAM-dependent methyltransferase
LVKQITQLEVYPFYGQEVLRSKGVKRLIHTLIPRHAYMCLRTEIPLSFLRLTSKRVRRRFSNADNLMVNVGAGPCGKLGWINIDVGKAPLVNCRYDCRKSLPFPDQSVKCIFCEHFFEHIDYTEEIPYFLSDCHRVLKPGGVIRLIVPDIEKYLRAYCKGDWEDLSKIRPLDADRTDYYCRNRYNTRMELINVLFRQGHEHKFAYDAETLEFVLRRYGFGTVLRQEFGQSLIPELCLDQPARASESLYVEAQK